MKSLMAMPLVAFFYFVQWRTFLWIQAGFAMVETGFTRAKNAGNIIMKNLMDFCIGTVTFMIIGFSLLMQVFLFSMLQKKLQKQKKLELVLTRLFLLLFLLQHQVLKIVQCTRL